MNRIFLIIITLLTISAYSQPAPQNWNWYFGYNCAINFSSGNPVANTGCEMRQLEGCASISDTNGDLMFYTDGIHVWNKINDTMSNGFGLLGHGSSTQSALIVPHPDSGNIYYIFTTPQQNDTTGLNYSEVDMTLDGGLGDVTVKNVKLLDSVCEKLCAVKHCNNIDYWVVVHGISDNTFYSYLVTSTGISAPVLTNIGISIVNYSGQWRETIGYLKSSSNGKKMVATWFNLDTVQVFDFDNSTGMLSNTITINQHFPYGTSFSPNDSVLYIHGCDAPELYQYHISLNDQTMINISRYLVDSVTALGNNGGALQLGPDGKIYVCQVNYHYLDVINNPNIIGSGCNFVANAVNLGNGVCKGGLPNFIDAYNPTCSYIGIKEVPKANHFVEVYPNPACTSITFRITTATSIEELNIINIIDVFGRGVYKETCSGIDTKIDVSQWSEGVYFYEVRGEKETYRGKFIKQ